MAVTSYQSPSGQTLWKASVCVRSETKASIRVQKAKFAIKSEWEARREETRLIRECEREVHLRESQGSSWGSVVEAWERHLSVDKAATLNETTRTDYLNCMRKHTGAFWKRQAASITRADVIEVLNQLKAHSSSVSYQNKMKAIINGIFSFGIDHRMIEGVDRSPAYGISLGREEEKKPEILTLAEIRKLLQEARRMKHEWYPIWSMALLTGMRSGELYALEWSDVDLENKVLSVNKSYNPRRKVVKSTKAGYWRHVPISDELEALLKELKATSGSRPEVLPRFWEWTKGLQAKRLRAFCEGIGIPSIKFHTLRACFSTQLIRNGVAPAVVMKICGWKDLETMQRYIRLAGIETQGATNVLRVLPEADVAAQVVNLFTRESVE
jgi:integrase